MNPRILFMAVIGLTVTLILCVGLIGLLAMNSHVIPDILQNIASADLAGLIGLLVQTKDEHPAGP